MSFISRCNLEVGRFAPALVELPDAGTTMMRQFGVAHRSDGYLSPAAKRFIDVIRTRRNPVPASKKTSTRDR